MKTEICIERFKLTLLNKEGSAIAYLDGTPIPHVNRALLRIQWDAQGVQQYVYLYYPKEKDADVRPLLKELPPTVRLIGL
jgi:hypothetical protein